MSTATKQKPVAKKWRKLLGLIPGYDPFRDAAGCWFDAKAAEHAIAFIEEVCTHIEGDKAGQQFLLEDWQKSIIANLFGWKRHDAQGREVRRYRKLLLYIPRKNGKTPLAAAICLLVLMTDGEQGAQIYGAAGDADQASLLFRHAVGMVEAEPELASRLQIYTGQGQKSILYGAERSFYKVVSGRPHGRHGYNPSMVLIDELHVADRDMVRALTSAFVSLNRKQPLTVYITTADYERESVCNETHDYASKVRDGIIEDPAFLPAIWETSREDADATVDTPDGPRPYWTTPECWARVNPNLGVSVNPEFLEAECRVAMVNPAAEGEFKRLYLNCKTEVVSRWLNMAKWDACAAEVTSPEEWRAAQLEELRGEPCFAGLDIGATDDLTALVLVFPRPEREVILLPWFFAATEGKWRGRNESRPLYESWHRRGFLELTPGDATDYDGILARAMELHGRFRIRKGAMDASYQGLQVAHDLAQAGIEMEAYPQSPVRMTAPSREFEDRVIAGKVRHGANPILRWMASNVCVVGEKHNLLKPVKPKRESPLKVDGIIAAIMGLALAMAEPAEEPSVYETERLLVLTDEAVAAEEDPSVLRLAFGEVPRCPSCGSRMRGTNVDGLRQQFRCRQCQYEVWARISTEASNV